MRFAKISVWEAERWYIRLKPLFFIARRGGSAPVEEVSRAILEETGDELYARAWLRVVMEDGFVRIRGGVVVLSAKGRRLIKSRRIRQLVSEVEDAMSGALGREIRIE